MFRYLPEQASDFADEVDWIHHVITDISVFFTVAIVGAMIYFAVRYRRRNGVDHETPAIQGNVYLEIIWTVVPTIICVFVAAYGFWGYQTLRQPPDNAKIINVIGQKWSWTFQYENGKTTRNTFVVPVDEPIKLVMTSRDVLHSFFIPSMRVKSDVVPGQYTFLWFNAIKTGTYNVFCTEYCGLEHSRMLATLEVVSRAEYERWLADDSEERLRAALPPAELGLRLYQSFGCNDCHSVDGTRRVGPTFLQLYNKEGLLADGSTYVADENYIRRSILDPSAEVTQGYPDAMPSYEGQVDDEQIDAIIAFIRTLDDEAAIPELEEEPIDDIDREQLSPVERGELLYRERICVTCHSLDGTRLVGPTFQGLWMKEGTLEDGSTYVADEEYIRRSILDPNAEITQGYPPAMPSYEGQVDDQDISDLIEFIKSLD